MEPLWLPLLSGLRQRAGGSIGFPLQLKGYFSPSLGWKRWFSSADSFFRWGVSGRKETITRGVKTAGPARPVGEEEDLDPTVDGEKPEISGNGWKWPKKNFHHPRPVPSDSISHNGLSLQNSALPKVLECLETTLENRHKNLRCCNGVLKLNDKVLL